MSVKLASGDPHGVGVFDTKDSQQPKTSTIGLFALRSVQYVDPTGKRKIVPYTCVEISILLVLILCGGVQFQRSYFLGVCYQFFVATPSGAREKRST